MNSKRPSVSSELYISTASNHVDDGSAPPSPYGAVPKPATARQITSLKDEWNKAKVRFQKRTKQPIDAEFVDMDAFLESWGRSFDSDDSEKGRKKKQILNVIYNIVDGINLVGELVGSASSIFSGMAGPCFNALKFLLEIPRRIVNVYDSLLELFEEFENFLVKFKILRRIVSLKRLPGEILEKASTMLISFVDICGLAFKILQSPIRTGFSAALLQNNDVGDALIRFRRMAQGLDSWTNTIALESILDVRETGRETNSVVKEGNTAIMAVDRTVKSLEQTSNDDKTMKVNESRLKTIGQAIYTKGERVAERLPDFPEDLLPETLSILKDHEVFRHWHDAPVRSGRAALLLTGPTGSGKSRFLEALKESLDETRQNAVKDEESTYAAYHTFSGRVNKASSSQIPFALRSMAVQVAEQSTAYAKELEAILKADKSNPVAQMDVFEDLWEKLKLSTFKTKAQQATMYLLFDGIEHESENMVNRLLNLFEGKSAKKAQKRDTVSIRAIFTIDPSRNQINSTIPSIDMSIATKDLVQTYAAKELKKLGLFQSYDKKSIKRREKIMDAVKSATQDDSKEPSKSLTFMNVKQKLGRVDTAIQDDALDTELDDILQDDKGQSVDPKVRQSLRDLASKLTSREIDQINYLLPWLLYSEYAQCSEVEELEAVLYLAYGGDSLQSLLAKIRGKFRDLFCRSNHYIILRPDIEKILREADKPFLSTSKKEASYISLDISVHNVEESVARRFVWQLNETMSMGKFDFETAIESGQGAIAANELEGHLSITGMCLKLLNEGWVEETEVLLVYALRYLPRHFVYLANHSCYVSSADKRAIGHGLVSLLSEPFHLYQDLDRTFGDGEEWLENDEAIECIKNWLLLTRNELQPRDRRWIDKALSPERGHLGYIKDFACAVGKKWVRHEKDDATERDYCDEVRNCNALERYCFMWLDKFIENDKKYDPNEDALNQNKRGTGSGAIQRNAIQDVDELETLQPNHKDIASPSDDAEEPALHLTRTKTPAETPIVDKVQRAVEWLQLNEVAYLEKERGVAYLNIGYTYLSYGEHDKAEEYFVRAMQDKSYKRQGLIALGRICYARDKKDEAASRFEEALNIFEKQKARSGLSDYEKAVLAELYCELAVIYEKGETPRLNERLTLYRKSLDCKDDLSTKWKALKLLCEAKQDDSSHEATDLLHQWLGNGDDNGEIAVAQAIRRSVLEQPDCTDLENFLRAIRHDNLRAQVTQAFSDAVAFEDDRGDLQTKAQLLYLQGLAVVRELGENRWFAAANFWEDALSNISAEAGTSWGYECSLEKAACLIGQHCFDSFLAELGNDASTRLSNDDKDVVVQNLAHTLNIKVLGNPRTPILAPKKMIERYLIALNIVLGRVDEARWLTRENVSTALDILSDEDSDNDIVGIELLMSTMSAMGDTVGVLTAFSLLDRKPREHKDLINGPNDDGSHPMDIIANYTAWCNDCGKPVSSSDRKGFWWCQYRADFDLCINCHGKILNGSSSLFECDQNTKFMRMYHTDYADEEKSGNMVRIGWELEDLGNGLFNRKGGQLVPLKEWLEKLRVTWEIPDIATNSRAQK